MLFAQKINDEIIKLHNKKTIRHSYFCQDVERIRARKRARKVHAHFEDSILRSAYGPKSLKIAQTILVPKPRKNSRTFQLVSCQ